MLAIFLLKEICNVNKRCHFFIKNSEKKSTKVENYFLSSKSPKRDISGVVDCGLFVGVTDGVFFAYPDGSVQEFHAPIPPKKFLP